MKTLGMILVIVGLMMTLVTGIKFINHKKVAEIGSLSIEKKETTPIYWSPVTGILLAGIGGTILLLSRNKSMT